MVTQDQLHLVRESFPLIDGQSVRIAALFYGRLFDVAPEVRSLFREDIDVQGRKLMDMLTALVDNLYRLEEMQPVLKALGQRHAGYGVRPEHYPLMAAALLWALGIALEGDFPSERKIAWATLIDSVSAVMMAGAAELPPH